MRFILINQFVPPDTSPTSKLLGDLAAALREAGHEVQLVGRGGGYQKQSLHGIRRWLRDLTAHLRLLFQGLAAGRCDVVLCLTDPPALPVTAALMALLKRAHLAHWAMDVYPQIARALGALPPGRIEQGVAFLMRWAYRRCRVLVALDQDMKAELESMAGHEARMLPPWPPELPAEAGVAPSDWNPKGERIWLYSGNLGRAHDFQTLLETQALLEQHPTPWRLIFQGGGPAWPQAQQLAEQLGLSRCEWLPYAEETQLLARLQQADVLIATQKPETRGLLWPSKLALMQLLERPILFVGPRDSALAQSLRSPADDRSPHGVIAPGDAAAAAAYLLALPERRPALPHQQIHERVHDLRQKGLQQWLAWLNEWHGSHQAAKTQR